MQSFRHEIELVITGVAQAEYGILETAQRVQRQTLAQQKPPERTHVVRFIALALRRANEHNETFVDQSAHIVVVHRLDGPTEMIAF